jgi:hypothetical protein
MVYSNLIPSPESSPPIKGGGRGSMKNKKRINQSFHNKKSKKLKIGC